jgi:hypothetical protein
MVLWYEHVLKQSKARQWCGKGGGGSCLVKEMVASADVSFMLWYAAQAKQSCCAEQTNMCK